MAGQPEQTPTPEPSAAPELEAANEAWAPSKSELIRDAIAFQIKLAVDGFRDLILVPISLGAALLSFLRPGAQAGREFYDVVALGRATERKINLFSAADKIEPPAVAEDLPDLDKLVDDIEAYAREEYASERFATARERLKNLQASLQGGAAKDESSK